MKFVVKNLGPIDEAELELGDLTIIAGRNNTGKTYAAYTLYGFLKWWSEGSEVLAVLDELSRQSLFPNFSDNEGLVKTATDKGQVKWSTDRKTLNSQRKLIVQEVNRSFPKEGLARVFSASDEDFSDASVEVAIDNEFPEDAPGKYVNLFAGDRFTLTYTDNEICLSRSEALKTPFHVAGVSLVLQELYLSFLFPEFPTTALTSPPLVFPAERLSISLFYKELDATKSHVVEIAQENRRRDKRLPFSTIDKMTSRYALPIWAVR